MEAEAAGLFATAARHWLTLVRRHPEDAELRWRHAEALRLDGDRDGARQALRKALVTRPDHAGAAFRFAEMLFQDGDAAEGMVWLKRIMARRPDDDELRIGVLEFCARHGMIGQVRVQAERMLRGDQPPSARLSTALAFLFGCMGDHGRALEAARAAMAARKAPARSALLAAHYAELAGAPEEAGRILGELIDGTPSGAAYGRRARALAESGEADAAAAAIGSALLTFATMPEHLADMAHMLAAPRHARLCGVLLDALQAGAAGGRADARIALALVHYRLGDSRETGRLLDADASMQGHPALAVARANIAAAADLLEAGSGTMPADALARGLPGPPRGTPAAAEGLVVLLDREGWTGRQRGVMEVAKLAAERHGMKVSVIQRAPPGVDAAAAADAARLAGALAGIADYVVLDPAGASPAEDSALGYLTPALAAETGALQHAIAERRPAAVHLASAGMMMAGGLGAVMAGVPRLFLHAGADWLSDGPQGSRAFRSAFAHLARRSQVRVVAASDASGEALRAYAPEGARRPLLIPTAVDSRDLRRRSGGRERRRAAELLELGEGADFLSVFGALTEEAGLADLLERLDADALPPRIVLWRHAPGPAALTGLGGSAGAALRRRRWPIEPAPFLGHARLAIAWNATERHRLSVLQHVIMGVPVLLADSPDLEDLAGPDGAAMALATSEPDAAARETARWLGDAALRRVTAEAAARNVRRVHNVERALRRVIRLHPRNV
ncbi:hypothetical protein CVT23_15325 [Minwuia thermotolerans]|uniref:Uncharacterized protein n=1 Tax=Minwuia thermotolerans TaxID=2056226 RepID=A0A2M9FZ22_9PROT|nr:hypothetical protein CVT23_15325 [Minwuia thermotolerans]